MRDVRAARPTAACAARAARSVRPEAWRTTPSGKGSPHSLTELTDPRTENAKIILII